MEIDITNFFNNECPKDFSASASEIGNNAGAYTWRAAMDTAEDYDFLDNDDKREEFRRHVKEYGAWTEEEIARWTNTELNVLLIQMIAGDMREGDLEAGANADDWRDYHARCALGNCNSNIFKTGDVIYYSFG